MKANLLQIVQAKEKPVKLIFESNDPELMRLTFADTAMLAEKPVDLYFHLRLGKNDGDAEKELQLKLAEMHGRIEQVKEAAEETAEPVLEYTDKDGTRYFVADGNGCAHRAFRVGPNDGDEPECIEEITPTEDLEEAKELLRAYAEAQGLTLVIKVRDYLDGDGNIFTVIENDGAWIFRAIPFDPDNNKLAELDIPPETYPDEATARLALDQWAGDARGYTPIAAEVKPETAQPEVEPNAEPVEEVQPEAEAEETVEEAVTADEPEVPAEEDAEEVPPAEVVDLNEQAEPEPTGEPVVEEPAAAESEPAPEPAAEPAPVTDPAPEETAEPAAEQVAEPIAEPGPETPTEPAAEGEDPFKDGASITCLMDLLAQKQAAGDRGLKIIMKPEFQQVGGSYSPSNIMPGKVTAEGVQILGKGLITATIVNEKYELYVPKKK
jgi:hypothetical protein